MSTIARAGRFLLGAIRDRCTGASKGSRAAQVMACALALCGTGCRISAPPGPAHYRIAARLIEEEPSQAFSLEGRTPLPTFAWTSLDVGSGRTPPLMSAAAATAEAGRSWRVDLGSEVRSAFQASDGRIVWDVAVPRNGVLRFGYGIHDQAKAGLHFTISRIDGSGERRLFEAAVDPRNTGTAGRWHDGVVDVAALGGERVRLAFAATAPVGPALGFWADPVVLEPVARRATPPNVVLISMDTVRADRLSLYGYRRRTSPRIESWARRRGVTFRTAVAPSPWTLPSHASLFSGLDALTHGVNPGDPAPPSLVTLAERLRRAGYVTQAITGGGFLHPAYGLGQGFDRYRYWPSTRSQDDELEQGVKDAAAWMRENATRPFFLFFHTYEPHAPYRARLPYARQLAEEGVDWKRLDRRLYKTGRVVPRPDDGYLFRRRIVYTDGVSKQETPAPADELDLVGALYDSGIAYVDEGVGRLLDEVEGLGLAPSTLVVVTSDHGEALGERGLGSHGYLDDFNLLVPLVIAFPDGRGAGAMVGRQVRLIDVFPTVLQELGVTDAGPLDGAPLQPLIADPKAVFPREAWSYAGSTNRGFSIRMESGTKYLFNNTAWRPARGAEAHYALPEALEEGTPRVTDVAGARRLRESVRRSYLASFKGLRIEIHNAGALPLEVRLKGPKPVGLYRIKTFDESGEAGWHGGEGVRISVPSRASFELFAEGLVLEGPLSLELRGGAPGMARWRGQVEPRALLAGPLAITVKGQAWQAGTGGGPEGATGVFLTWTGPADAGGTPGPDPALQEKLRALGYVV